MVVSLYIYTPGFRVMVRDSLALYSGGSAYESWYEDQADF
jgi:hypothetical protein